MKLDDRYTEQMAQLLPPGAAWARSPGSVLRALLSGLAREFARIHRRALQLLDETDPRLTGEMLPDWERYLGLPGECAPSDQTQSERREVVVTKYTEVGGQSRRYFIDLAATLGFTTTITEYRPFVAGSLAGEPLTNGPWVHTWDVNAPAETVNLFRAGRSAAGEPLRIWGREAFIECEFRKRAPAHTLVRFTYHSAPVTARDLTDNDNDGTLVDGPTWIGDSGPTEQIIGALSFDGDDDRVTSDGEAFNFSVGSFTVEVWMKITKSGGGRIIDHVAPGEIQPRWSLYFVDTPQFTDALTFQIQDGSFNDSDLPISSGVDGYDDGDWHHVAAVVDRSADTLTLLIDGVEVAQDGDISDVGDISDPDGSLSIGDVRGMLTEIRVWSVARTQQQIQDNMDERMTGGETGLAGCWPLDDGVFPYPGIE